MPPKGAPLIAKPVASRYRRGKLPTGAPAPSDSDSDSDASQEQVVTKVKRDDDLVAGGAGRIIQREEVKASGKGKGIQLALKDVKVEQGGSVLIGGKREVGRTEMEESTDEEEDSEEEEDAKPVFRRPAAAAPSAKQEAESEYETDSEEEESEEEPAKPLYRPTFVPKRARETIIQRDAIAKEQEEADAKRQTDLVERKKESRDLLGETIRRELAEREAPDLIPDVDDTDNLSPETEFQDWRLRELSRLARDKEAAIVREEEREEIERRRALPKEQRDREDEEYARKTREEAREKRGEGRGFMEKFWHKGAFHQDEEIMKRDYNVKLESAVDKSMLPKAMQVRNFGKMSQTKYTHLKDQDTTQDGWNRALKSGPGGLGGQQQGCFNCGGPHLRRDCPNNNMSAPGSSSFSSRLPGTGTNTSALGSGSRYWAEPESSGSGHGGNQWKAPPSGPRGFDNRRDEPLRNDDRDSGRKDDSRNGPGNRDGADRYGARDRSEKESDFSRGHDRQRKDERGGRGDRYEGGERERDKDRRRSRSPDGSRDDGRRRYDERKRDRYADDRRR